MDQIGKIITHYKILEKLGEGGMGVVYKAEDAKLKRIVALKFLAAELTRDPEAKKRFMQEAQTAAALDHANICTVYEIDEAEGQTFISMAYLEGQTLKDKIKSGSLKLDEALDVAIQVAEGLQEAHGKGIVHRDIKPANIMITDKGQAKIMDFGLAKLRGQTKLTRQGTTLGTVAYMSPEQARGEEVDHRTDIWSLGVVLYEMVTGQLPFKGDYEQAVVYSILNEEPEPMTDMPTELEQIVKKALAKKAEERYQYAEEMISDLKSFKKKIESEALKEKVSTTKSVPSIAVLPFTNLSADPEQEYFCDGMAEELINALTHIKGLRVVARTSAFAFKGRHGDIREIGGKLDVQTVLEGSVRKAGNRLRISAQLVSVADGYHLWSEKYDRDLEDIFAIQDEISMAIVDKLEPKLLGEEKAKVTKRYTEDPEAHSLYLKGRFFWNKRTKEGLKKSIEYFQRAIKKAPTYALAYAGLADAYNMLYSYLALSRQEAYRQARDAALEALKLDDGLAEAHTSMAEIRKSFEKDPKGANEEFKRAISLNPGYATAHHWRSQLLGEMGQFEEALKEANRALELDPLSAVISNNLASFRSRLGDWRGAEELHKRVLEIDPTSGTAHASYALQLIQMGHTDEGLSEIQRALQLAPEETLANQLYGWILYLTRRYERAIEQMQKTIQMAPFSFDSHALLGVIYLQKQMYEEALEAFQKGKEVSRGPALSPVAVLEVGLGVTYAKMGKTDKAKEVLKDLIEQSRRTYVSPVHFAWLYFALAENDQGFEWLERAYEKRDYWLCNLKMDPLFDDVRTDPRFKAVLKRMGLE